MRRKLLLVVLLLLLFSGSFGAFAWWDRLNVTSPGEDIDLGEGIRLVLSETIGSTDKILVPAGSYYAADTNNYTTEYVFVYTLGLEFSWDEAVDIETTIENFQVEDLAPGEKPAALIVEIAGEDLEGNPFSEAAMTLRIDEALQMDDDEFVITITLKLVDHPNADPLYANDFDKLAGKTLSFNVLFEIVPFGE